MLQFDTKEKSLSRRERAACGPALNLYPVEWATLIVSAVYALWLLVKPASPFVFKSVVDVLGSAGPLVASLWCFATARCTRDRRPRLAAASLGLGVLSYGVGQAIWSWYEIVLRHDCPFPSWSDVAYLSAYPFLLIGILRMPRVSLTSALNGRVLLDGLMVMVALVTFSWYFLLGPTLLQGSETLLGKVMGVAYPLSDLVLLFCLLVLTAQEWAGQSQRDTMLVALGLVAIIASDTVFAYRTLQGTYHTGGLMDLGWVLGYMLVGAGGCALVRSNGSEAGREQGAPSRNPVLWCSLAPYALVPAVGALLSYTVVEHGNNKLEPGVWLGSALLLGLLLLRQVFAIQENSKLYRYLQEAYREMEDVKGVLEVQNRSLADVNARLENLATTDSLTGLTNHRAFHERLEQEWANCVPGGRPLSLILMDVDHFKQYNDTFGHPAGDEVLQTVACLLSSICREGDLAARHGGEEYALILPQTREQDALALAERLRAALEACFWQCRPITASLGVATVTLALETPGELISAADTALYRSKSAGRNLVTAYVSPTAASLPARVIAA